MKILNEKNDNLKLIGSHIPVEDITRLSLYCILEGVSKSKFFKDLIQEELKQIPELNKLINLVYKEILTNWTNKKEENKHKKDWKSSTDIHKNFLKYLTTLKVKLTKKKIPQDIILKIINKLDQ